MKKSIIFFVSLAIGVWFFLKDRKEKQDDFEKIKTAALVSENASQVPSEDLILIHCEDGDMACSSREVNLVAKLKDEMHRFIEDGGDEDKIQLKSAAEFNIKKQELQNLLKEITRPIPRSVLEYEDASLNRLLEVADSLECSNFLKQLLVFSSSSEKELFSNVKKVKKLMSSQKNSVQSLIKIKCKYVSNDDFQKIINLLSPLQNLTRLELSGSFDDESMKQMCKFISQFSFIREIALLGNYSDDRIDCLCSSIQDFRNLEILFFQGKFSDEGALRFTQLLENNITIKDFGLKGSISNKKIDKMIEILTVNPVLEIFRLHGTFNGQGARQLAQFLFSRNNLKEVYLDGSFQDLNMFSQIYAKVKKVIINGIQLRY